MANFYLDEYNKVGVTYYGDLQQYVVLLKSSRGDLYEELKKALIDVTRVLFNIEGWHSRSCKEYEEVRALREAIIEELKKYGY